MNRSRQFILRIALLSVLIGTLAQAVYFCHRYRGFVRFVAAQLWYGTWTEDRNFFLFLDYWVEYIQKLAPNPNTGIYGFEKAAQQPMDDFEAGKMAYHLGDYAGAVTFINSNIKHKGETESKLFWLAMSYLREAEAQNCLAKLRPIPGGTDDAPEDGPHAHEVQFMCSLPLVQFHQQPENSRQAAKVFERLLDRYDPKNDLYRWLLNFCYMTIHGFPQQVPSRYLIRSRFIDTFYGDRAKRAEAENSTLAFAERAKDLGVANYGTGRGVAVEDFDKDGFLDIVTGGQFEGLKYYKNDRGARFIDETVKAGLDGVKQPFIITAADYDNDGWPDLFIARPLGRFQLFHNNQNGTFTDVTASSGLVDGMTDDEIAATWVSAWADVNNDGFLDLFLAQWSMKVPFAKGLLAKPAMDSKLFINDHGHFIDRTREYGLADLVKGQTYVGATFGDYNSDGYPDLFLSSPARAASVLLKNVAGQRFYRTNAIPPDRCGFLAAFLDVNHDGKLDILQVGTGDARTATQMAVFGEDLEKNRSNHTTLYVQTADGHFEGDGDFFDMPIGAMGASFGDINNDGCYDFYLGTGDPESWFVLPNLMYLGESEGTHCLIRTKNISMLQGFGTVQKGHGIVFFDFNNDGKQDIYSSLGGMWPSDSWANQFFVNNSKVSAHWVDIRLHGHRTNFFGVGCTIRVIAESPEGESIERYYLMNNGTGFGSSPYLVHLGLMNAVRINKIEVYWPVSRHWESYDGQLDKLNYLEEGVQGESR
jgi:FG-GAP-like repeat/FG-GAP repeat